MTTIPTGRLGPHTVRRVGYGAMQLAGPGVFGPPRDRDEALAVLREAVQGGVDHIDTSQYYGPDIVNELIHEALYPFPDGLHLVSKVGGRRDERGGWLPAQRPEELRSGVEDNLRSLEIERLTMVNLRLMDAGGGRPDVPLAEQLGTMYEMVDEGKIELIGISNADVPLVREALEQVPLACVQNAYSVIDRAHQDVLELCAERRMAFVPFFPLGSAFTGGPAALAADPAIAEVAERHGATPAQVALAWLLARDQHVLLIPGTASRRHLEENLEAGELELTAEDMATLEQVRPVGNPLAGHD